jgi:transcription-repair coupling factor (superfamily II helicase)
MLYQKIAPYLEQSQFFASLFPLQPGTQIHHLSQSARALLAAHLWVKSGKNLILVSQDDIIAEDLWDDLVSLVGRENAFYLPDYEILPYEDRSPHYSIRATRMITLLNALSDTPAIYSLSIRSLLRLIPNKESLSRHVLTLKQGDSIDPDELLHKLHDMGYEIEYQVSKVYQAAKRGGILDVFSPPAQHPVRLEFWGDEIISLRSFSASTQRSIPADILELTLIPAREISLDDIVSGSVIIAKVRDHGFFEGIENYYSLLTRELSSFADYFPASSRIFAFINFSYIKEEMEALLEQTFSQYRKVLKSQSKAKTPPPKRLMLDEEAYCQMIASSASCIFLKVNSSSRTQANIRLPSWLNPPLNLIWGCWRILCAASRLKAGNISCSSTINPKNVGCARPLPEMPALPATSECCMKALKLKISSLGSGYHEIYNRYKRKRYAPRFAPGETIVDYENLKPGDYVVHIDHGIGVFEG